MFTFEPLSRFREPFDVPTWLDFAHHFRPRELPLLLRIHTLFCGDALIPSTFLLHNKSLAEALEVNDIREDFRNYVNTPFVNVSVPDREDLKDFLLHWEASTNSHNPSVIHGGKGREHALRLREMTERKAGLTFEAQARLDGFQEDFLDLARVADLPASIIERVLDLSKVTKTREKGKEIRESVDKISGLTRSDVMLMAPRRWRLSSTKYLSARDADFRKRYPEVSQIADAAYYRGIARTFNDSSQQVAIISANWNPNYGHRRPVNALELLAKAEFNKLFAQFSPVRVDLQRVVSTNWTDMRRFADGQAYRNYIRDRNFYASNDSEQNLKNYLSSSADYLRAVGERFGTAATRSYLKFTTHIMSSSVSLLITFAHHEFDETIRAGRLAVELTTLFGALGTTSVYHLKPLNDRLADRRIRRQALRQLTRSRLGV